MMSNISDMLLLLLVSFAIVSFFLLNKKASKKKFFCFLMVIIIFLAFYVFRERILSFIKEIPFVWKMIGPIVSEVEKGTLLGLFYITSLGALFFLSIPVEVSFVYFLTLDHNAALVVMTALFGSMVGLTINYFIGFLFGEKVFRYFLKEKFDKFKETLDRFGGGIILFGNIIPFPSELFSAILGSTKYNFKKFIIYTFIGRVMKFSLIFFAKDLFTERILPKIKSLF